MKNAELLVYDVIGQDFWSGGGITAKAFAEQLAALDLRAGDTLTLKVNSPGGDVFEGYAIYNQLLAYPATKVVKVEGLAASAASYIIQAADTIEVAEASFVMIHDAWGMTVGNADDHITVAAELEKFDGVIAGIYAKRSGRPVEEFAALMSAETWFTGQEAIDAKLADRLIPSAAMTADAPSARFDERALARFRKAPPAARVLLFPSRVAAMATTPPPRAEGKVLSAKNQDRLNQIRDLAQSVLDDAGPKPKEDDEPSNKGGAALTLMQIDIDLAHAGLEAL